MSKVLDKRQKFFHTDIGYALVTTTQVDEFDVDDAIHVRAMAQAKVVQLVNIGKAADINSPTAPRTIKSKYLSNTEELPE